MRIAAQLQQHAEAVRRRVAETAAACGRRVDEITIVAITKTRSLEEVRQAVELGFSEIGESRVQETEEKFRSAKPDCRLHLVGHLQTNKVKKAIGLFDLIQSVDSLKLAEKINAEAEKAGSKVSVLLEVNTSDEQQKFGFEPGKVQAAADKVAMMNHLVLAGLMTVGPLTEDESSIRAAFGRLRTLFESIKSDHPELEKFRTLSMGMTDDYHLAIREGATMLRIGRGLFGSRST